MRTTGSVIVALALVVGCAGQKAGGIAGGQSGEELTGDMVGQYVAALPRVAAAVARGTSPEGTVSLAEAVDDALVRPGMGLRSAVRRGGYHDLDTFAHVHRRVWEAYHYLAVWSAHAAVKRGIEEGNVRKGEGGVTTVEELQEAYDQGERFSEQVSGRVKANAQEVVPFFNTLRGHALAFERDRRG